MLAISMARMVLRPMVPRLAISPTSLGISPASLAINPTLSTTPCCSLHTSEALERARQSTRIKKRKVNMANKKKKEERLRKNPPPIPKKVQLMLVAKGLGKEPRPWRRADTRPFPSDDVWAEQGAAGTPGHTHPRFPVGEAVAMLREHCHPTMLNLPDALVWAKLEFNLQASKKEKYVDGFSAMVPVAHPFERGVAVKSVLVFCLRPEGAQAAEAAGATRVGGLELVEDIVKGKVDVADIDHFLADEGLEKELKPLLGGLGPLAVTGFARCAEGEDAEEGRGGHRGHRPGHHGGVGVDGQDEEGDGVLGADVHARDGGGRVEAQADPGLRRGPELWLLRAAGATLPGQLT